MPEVNGPPKFGTVYRLNDGYTRPDKGFGFRTTKLIDGYALRLREAACALRL